MFNLPTNLVLLLDELQYDAGGGAVGLSGDGLHDVAGVLFVGSGRRLVSQDYEGHGVLQLQSFQHQFVISVLNFCTSFCNIKIKKSCLNNFEWFIIFYSLYNFLIF